MRAVQSSGMRKAKPLLYMIMLIGAWVIARIIVTLWATQLNHADIKFLTAPLADGSQISPKAAHPKNIKFKFETIDQQKIASAAFATKSFDSLKMTQSPSDRSHIAASPSIAASSNGLPPSYYTLLFLNAMEERSNSLISPNLHANNGWNLPPGNGPKLTQLQQSNQSDALESSNLASRLSGYAYIFARSNSGDADALGGRYGGSQAAVQLAYRTNPNQAIAIDATLRAQTALSDSDREVALGVSIKPSKKLPLTIVAERRFRPSNPDGYALYVAGGKSNISLPANFKLQAYGQAGVSSAGRDTLFFDGQLMAEKSIYINNAVKILAGGGAWAGGQRGTQRLDIGPSVSIKLSKGQRNYRISGDWRERIGGNASPNSGAAITLSTDF